MTLLCYAAYVLLGIGLLLVLGAMLIFFILLGEKMVTLWQLRQQVEQSIQVDAFIPVAVVLGALVLSSWILGRK